MTDTALILIAPAGRAQDAGGVWHTVAEKRREIFARVDSAGRSEFFSGGQNGLRPEYRFTVFAAEYRDEAECEWQGRRYAIYRVYHVPGTDDLEIYAQRKAGVHGG